MNEIYLDKMICEDYFPPLLASSISMILSEALFLILSFDSFVGAIKDSHDRLEALIDGFIIILVCVFSIAQPILNEHIALILL
jgi:hypothetical protein